MNLLESNGMNNLRALLPALAATLIVAACAQPKRVPLPPPVQPARVEARTPAEQTLISGTADRRPTELVRTATPAPPAAGPAASGIDADTALPPMRGAPVNVNIEGVPVPTFINEFFGTILGVGFQMEPAVANMSDLVTLRTPGPQSPQNFYRLATRVLRTYGVATEYDGGRVLFSKAAKDAGDGEPPLVVSGRALPDVPVTHRPVFQLIELQAVRTADVSNWLKTAFKSGGLEIQDDLNRNAIVLYGKPELVRQAAAAIRVLDRPYMHGRLSTRLEPAFVGADELARRLVDVLVSEGYGAALHTGSGIVQAATVIVLPIASANAVLLFTGDAALLEHAVQWSRTIDRPNPASGGSQSLFYYLVQNTRAEEIVATLNGVRAAASATLAPTRTALSSGQAGAATGATMTAPASPAAGPAAPGPVPPTAGVSTGNLAGGQLVLDAPRNAIIFQGPAADWERLLPLVRQMDKAARQVMIEVTIAEVSLDDNEEFGVSWLARNTDIGRFNGTVTSGVLGAATGTAPFGGLTYLLDIAGQNRAQLRAFADDNRVTVLSTPRLLVKSGDEASIDVGTEIPTISAQTASVQQTEGNSNILQSVQYRKTGIILNVKPTVYSDNRIDLEIRQEVSEALPLSADASVQSPSIFNRAVATSLSLRDGSSILIGGLMSRKRTDADSGVPYLKDVPVLGNLFKSRSRRANKTELVLMIVPYIVESDSQATALTRSVSERLELLDVPVAPPPAPAPVPSVPVPVRDAQAPRPD
jgi:general secretion pathway protein D